jgi:hypothetical protein
MFCIRMSGWELDPSVVGPLNDPLMIDDRIGAVDGMMIGRYCRSSWSKPVRVPVRTPQIPQWTHPRENPGHPLEKPVNCRLSINLKLHGLSPRAHCTDRATAACRRSDCQLVRIEGATWSAWQIPPAVFSRFSRQEPLLFYQVAPQLYSRGWVGPRSKPTTLFFFW